MIFGEREKKKFLSTQCETINQQRASLGTIGNYTFDCYNRKQHSNISFQVVKFIVLFTLLRDQKRLIVTILLIFCKKTITWFYLAGAVFAEKELSKCDMIFNFHCLLGKLQVIAVRSNDKSIFLFLNSVVEFSWKTKNLFVVSKSQRRLFTVISLCLCLETMLL